MADIFVSYASEDRMKVETLVSLFPKAHWTSWWDRQIAGGAIWRGEIEKELATCRCTVVLWSRASVTKEWVKREARIAREREVLLPVLLEPVQPPDDLADVQAIPLTAWLGDARSFELRPFLSRLARMLGCAPPDVDISTMETISEKIARIEVAEATFAFCAIRLEFLRLVKRRDVVPDEVTERMRLTFDRLSAVLAPASSDDVHALVARNESSFTP